MRTPDELVADFRARGLKITPQRLAVFRALHATHDHPTAEAVHATIVEDMPSVSLRTVYQVLHDLSAMGVINAIDLGTGSLRFDPTPVEHHHLVCRACGAVRDVFLDDVDIEVPTAQAAGFRLDRPEITFRGLCPDCSESTQTPRKAVH